MDEARAGEERIGGITVRTTDAAVEIDRARREVPPSRAQAVAILVALFLAVALATLATFTGSRPVLGVAPVPLIALVVGAFLQYQRARAVSVRVDAEAITWRGAGKKRVPKELVESVGIGNDGGHRTVWLAVRGVGRLLVLEGLTDPEAELAAARLRAAV